MRPHPGAPWSAPLHEVAPQLVAPPGCEYTLPRNAIAYAGAVFRVSRAERGGVTVVAKLPGHGVWIPAPLRQLAASFPVGTPIWIWLAANGVRRPQPSGKGTPRARRGPHVEVPLTDELRGALAAFCAKHGRTKPDVAQAALCMFLGLPQPVMVTAEDARKGASQNHRLRVKVERLTDHRSP